MLYKAKHNIELLKKEEPLICIYKAYLYADNCEPLFGKLLGTFAKENNSWVSQKEPSPFDILKK